MPKMSIQVEAGTVREIYTEGLNVKDLHIEIRDYDVECIGSFGEKMWVDEYGNFLIVDDWGMCDFSDSRKPRVRETNDTDFYSDQHTRANRKIKSE